MVTMMRCPLGINGHFQQSGHLGGIRGSFRKRDGGRALLGAVDGWAGGGGGARVV